MGNAAQLCRALDRDVVAHELDERNPGGGRLAASLEDGAGEGGSPRDAGRSGLGERVDADLVDAAPLADVFSEQQEHVGGQAHHDYPKGSRSSHMDLPHPPERPPGGIVAKQRSGWALGQIPCLAGKSMAFGDLAAPESSAVI